jgi:hypothetical protein
MSRKNFFIMAVTVAVTLFLAAYMFVGLGFWSSPAGAGLAVAIAVVSCAVPFFYRARVPGLPQAGSMPLPRWVRTWQRIAILLFVLASLVLFYQYGRT